MGKVRLEMKATLENVAEVKPSSDSFGWNVKFRCTSCGEMGDNFNRLEVSDKTAIPGSRGEANLVIKCKFCSRVNTVDIIPDSVTPYTAEDSDQFKKLVVFDCRGVEPTDYFFGNGFTCTSEGGTQYEDINLEEGEWVEYDEKAGQSVGIYSATHRFVKD